jgi:hypothetical protein
VGLFFWVMVNSTVARRTGVNGTVLMLCALEGMLVYRMVVTEPVELPERPLAMAG